MAKGRRIRFVVDDTGASRWYRAEVPGDELRRRGHHVTIGNRLDRSEVPSLDVVVFHRQFLPGAVAAIEHVNASGKVSVYDIDDDYWNVPPTNPLYERWRDPGLLRGLEACVRAAQVVTTPSPVLAESLRGLNPVVRVLPNMLRGEDWPLPERRESERVVIGWGGSASHLPDLRMLAGAIEQVLASEPRAEFRTHGLREVPFAPGDRLRVLPGVPLEDYPSLVASFDVGLAPLEDTRFNRCKSDLKVLEYAAAGVAVAASKVAPYERAVRPGETGLLVGPSAKDWLKAVRRLVTDGSLRAGMGRAGRAWAETRFIERDANIGRWEKAYGL